MVHTNTFTYLLTVPMLKLFLVSVSSSIIIHIASSGRASPSVVGDHAFHVLGFMLFAIDCHCMCIINSYSAWEQVAR